MYHFYHKIWYFLYFTVGVTGIYFKIPKNDQVKQKSYYAFYLAVTLI